MANILQRGFNIQGSEPIDSRFTVANSAARLAITNAYDGLLVYQLDTDKLFVCNDSTNFSQEASWTEITNQTLPEQGGTGAGFPFEGNAVLSGSLELYNNALGSSTLDSYIADSDNLKLYTYNSDEFAINNGLINNGTYNAIYEIFNDSTTTCRLTRDALISIDLGSEKVLDKIKFTYNSDEVTREIEIYGVKDFDVISEATLNTKITETSASLLALGATSPNNASNLYSLTSNVIDISLVSTDPDTTLVSAIPTINKSPFQYYIIKFNDVIIEGIGIQNNTDSNYTSIKNIDLYTQTFSKQSTTNLNNGLISSSEAVIGTLTVSELKNPDGTNFSSGNGGGTNVVANPAGNNDGGNLTNITVDGINYNIPSTTLGNLEETDQSIIPRTSNFHSLGSSTNKWKDLFAVNTFFGGIHEINLETNGLDKMQEGTVLSLQNGTMCPCKNEADPLVMGVVSKGENYPIVLGAEPVLVTGKVEEGDYIITSNVEGHGKGINPKHIYDQQLFGKIIAQAIEKGDGKSYTIKAMIRKM
jgi:hypothetical protein